MLIWFMYFLVYSFIGFILETGFSLVVTGGFVSKKCFVFSLLCPVYGIGALSIIGATKPFQESRVVTFIIGAITATVVEYVVDYLYEHLFSMHIWNYSSMPFNLNGRVCLLFSFFWGILSLLLVYWIHPIIKQYTPLIPHSVCTVLLLLFVCDAILSAVVLRQFGCKQALSLGWLMEHA